MNYSSDKINIQLMSCLLENFSVKIYDLLKMEILRIKLNRDFPHQIEMQLEKLPENCYTEFQTFPQ